VPDKVNMTEKEKKNEKKEVNVLKDRKEQTTSVIK